ncbi:hypothetical protein BM43_3221 [Burkholderia gladioli]|uniref:hypothetical protein n=1 Tax=Burkholderia gladioli TaxID=28095 RepID=UPI0005A6020D|nr:hypothetical protein [Burkholderia gladioli]AJW99170.1 hypothetical protein BM43_3221 [Burkholderia gladioli]ASD79176.1 hypothetical protein CEJ98_09235 [Burkholderia gladioli pv. gladioli]AWY55583.1 hypothetical protein A8H28_31925 [Burkholderia gladioli pv. gladioli]SPU87670.1 Uncharacterised protein [Burkholderia gladioli]
MARYAYFDKQVKAVLGWIDTVAYGYAEDPTKAFPADQMLPITDDADWHANDGRSWYVVDSQLTTTAPEPSSPSSN